MKRKRRLPDDRGLFDSLFTGRSSESGQELYDEEPGSSLYERNPLAGKRGFIIIIVLILVIALIIKLIN